MTFHLGSAALNQLPLDWSGNYTRIVAAIERARSAGVSWLCLPELTISGYGCADAFLIEQTYRSAWDVLVRLLPHTAGIGVAVGLPLRHQGLRYNALAVLRDQQLVAVYVKQHLAIDQVYYEYRWFVPWAAGREDVFSHGGLECPIGEVVVRDGAYVIGFEICEDMWSGADRPLVRYAARGVNTMLSAHASHYTLTKRNKVEDLLVESAERYACAYVYSNVLGNESGTLIFDGSTLIAGYDGHQGGILARGEVSSFQEVVSTSVRYEVDRPIFLVRTERDMYADFTQTAALGLWDYLRKSQHHCYVLSASGGADSSMCAVLVQQMLARALGALGVEGVRAVLPLPAPQGDDMASWVAGYLPHVLHMVYQKSANSSAATLACAEGLAGELGARFVCWSVEDVVALYTEKTEQALGYGVSWADHDVLLQSIQARARVPAVWMLANALRGLLISTSNRSELAVGYATMDGDTAGGLSPLATLSKVFILDWLAWSAEEYGLGTLRTVLSTPPTAELRPAFYGQEDEKDLMPYGVLADIERAWTVDRQGIEGVYLAVRDRWEGELGRAVLLGYIRRFFRLFRLSQWKRHRLAPGLHLGEVNLSADSGYRFPIFCADMEEAWFKAQDHASDAGQTDDTA